MKNRIRKTGVVMIAALALILTALTGKPVGF